MEGGLAGGRCLAAAAGLATALAAPSALADPPSSSPSIELWIADGDQGWAADLGVAVAGWSMFSVGQFALAPPSVTYAPFDGLGHHDYNAGLNTTSTVVVAVGLSLPTIAMPLIERYALRSSWAEALRVPVIFAESVSMTFGAVNLLKNALGECRPRAWSDTTQTCVGNPAGTLADDDRRAFPSLHTAPLAALAGASLGLYALSSDHRPRYLALLGVTTAMAASNVVLREVAGAHTWVDTGAGFAIGAGIGFGTALLHTRLQLPVTVSITPKPAQIVLGGVL